MTLPALERKIRAQLSFARFLQAYMPIKMANRLLNSSIANVPLGKDVSRAAVMADGVHCEWIIPNNCRMDQVLIYFHGGGFVFRMTPPHLQMVAYLAQKLGVRVLMVDYRLAPDHPFPAALDDCVTAYRWLLKQGIEAKHTVMAGDSAGGNLTITALMKLRDNSDPLPVAAACLSPVINLKNNNRFKAIRDPLLPHQATTYYSKSYVGHNDPNDPMLSPEFGNWHGLPPLLVHAGEDEVLREDAVRIDQLAKAAHIDVRLKIYPRMWHVWQLFLTLPQAIESLDEIVQFLMSHLRPTQLPTLNQLRDK